jgi:hypothetical protein
VHFAVVHRHENRGTVRKPNHLLHVQADGVAQDDGHIVAGAAIGAGSQNERREISAPRLVDGFDRRVPAHDENVCIVKKTRGRAEPREPAWFELDAGIAAEEPNQRHIAREHRNNRAVARREIIKVVGGAQTSAPRHVLHDHLRIAGNERTKVARQ